MKPFSSVIAALFLLLLPAAAENLCPCKFDNDDPPDCRVYGQLGDGKLIPWHRASQQCLDAHSIRISAVPPSTLDGMCDPPNANAFVNYLKFESTSAANSIKQSYPQFWDGDANPITLVPNINGVDCKKDASGCWNQIKSYFKSNPSEIEKNCQTFYNSAKKDKELEQSTVRIAICNDEVATADACGDLQSQVEQTKGENPNKACSAFGLGPVSGGSEKPPNCSESGKGGGKGGAPADSAAARASLRATWVPMI